MKIKSILSALLLMASTMASAQYLNVKLDDGTYRSFKTTPNMEVSFGEKKGTEVAESEQTVTVNGHKVTVKLAENTPASEVMVCAYIEGESVKVGAFSRLNYFIECIRDGEAITPDVSNDFYTFILSDISNDMVVTVGYVTVRFDLNNSNITDNFKDKPADITRIVNNSTIPRTYASAEKHSFRGWYTDANCTSPWNYSTGVTKSITLYAKWAEDPTGTQINGHDFVKLGGYYWATENVTHSVADLSIAQDSTYGSYYIEESYTALNAAEKFGGTWTLPSEAQWQALIDYCKWERKNDYEYNGTKMNGMLVTGRAGTYESGHSIFLPAAGFYDYGAKKVRDRGGYGYYWLADEDGGRSLEFRSVNRVMSDNRNPKDGLAVRPVSE